MYSTTDKPESDVFIFKQSLYPPLSKVEKLAEHTFHLPKPRAGVMSPAAYIS